MSLSNSVNAAHDQESWSTVPTPPPVALTRVFCLFLTRFLPACSLLDLMCTQSPRRAMGPLSGSFVSSCFSSSFIHFLFTSTLLPASPSLTGLRAPPSKLPTTLSIHKMTKTENNQSGYSSLNSGPQNMCPTALHRLVASECDLFGKGGFANVNEVRILR